MYKFWKYKENNLYCQEISVSQLVSDSKSKWSEDKNTTEHQLYISFLVWQELNRQIVFAEHHLNHADSLFQEYTLFFFRNNFIRTTRLKFAQKKRTSKEQLRLGFRCKCDWKFLLKNTLNTSRHYMWRFIADLFAVLNTEWAEKKIKTVPHSAKSIRQYNWHDRNKNNFKNNFKTIIQNLRTTSFGQNLLIL